MYPTVRYVHPTGVYNASLTTSVQWKENADQYHSVGGLRLEDNQVVVPHKGLYFVYSQASFGLTCQAEQDQRPEMVHLTYMVERWSDSYSSGPEDYETILHSGRTVCQQTSPGDADAPALQGKWFSTVYVGAVFQLHAGDLLKTVVDKKFLPKVEPRNGKTFFGVFAL